MLRDPETLSQSAAPDGAGGNSAVQESPPQARQLTQADMETGALASKIEQLSYEKIRKYYGLHVEAVSNGKERLGTLIGEAERQIFVFDRPYVQHTGTEDPQLGRQVIDNFLVLTSKGLRVIRFERGWSSLAESTGAGSFDPGRNSEGGEISLTEALRKHAEVAEKPNGERRTDFGIRTDSDGQTHQITYSEYVDTSISAPHTPKLGFTVDKNGSEHIELHSARYIKHQEGSPPRMWYFTSTPEPELVKKIVQLNVEASSVDKAVPTTEAEMIAQMGMLDEI